MPWNNGTLQLDNLRIVITNKHIHFPGEWVISVRELNWSQKLMALPSSTPEEVVKLEAIIMVKNHLSKTIQELNEYI